MLFKSSPLLYVSLLFLYRCFECGCILSHWYYEREGQLYCKKHYWARYGEHCHGCKDSITKGFVMVMRQITLTVRWQRWHMTMRQYWNKFGDIGCKVKATPSGSLTLHEWSQGKFAQFVTKKEEICHFNKAPRWSSARVARETTTSPIQCPSHCLLPRLLCLKRH